MNRDKPKPDDWMCFKKMAVDKWDGVYPKVVSNDSGLLLNLGDE